MTPEALLLHHQRETMRWLRGQLGLSQAVFARWLGATPTAAGDYEAGRRPPPLGHRLRLAQVLAPRLATAEGRAFVHALGRGEG